MTVSFPESSVCSVVRPCAAVLCRFQEKGGLFICTSGAAGLSGKGRIIYRLEMHITTVLF